MIGTTHGLWKAQRQETLAREATIEKDKALQQEAKQAEIEREQRRISLRCGSTYSIFAAADKSNRDKAVAQLLILLKNLSTTGHFTPLKVAQVQQETDFEWIRKNDEFVSFMTSLGPVHTP